MFTVLGASGYIGGRLVAALRDNGEECFAPLRDEAEIWKRELGHVIYAIGMTADFRTRPFDTVRAHVSVLSDVLENGNFESLTYLSSTRVYAGADSAKPDAMLSVAPSDPSQLYNLTKLAGESICLGCGRENTRVVRLSNVIGAPATRSENFLDSIVREALSGKLVLRSSPLSSKDYVSIDDVVGLLPLIAAKGKERIYNLASGRNIAHQEWTDSLTNHLGCQVIYEPGAPVLDFPPIDISTTVREFGFSPRSVIDMLPSLIASHSNPI